MLYFRLYFSSRSFRWLADWFEYCVDQFESCSETWIKSMVFFKTISTHLSISSTFFFRILIFSATLSSQFCSSSFFQIAVRDVSSRTNPSKSSGSSSKRINIIHVSLIFYFLLGARFLYFRNSFSYFVLLCSSYLHKFNIVSINAISIPFWHFMIWKTRNF